MECEDLCGRVGTRTAFHTIGVVNWPFTQLALSTFYERKYKIVSHTTHLEFSSRSRAPPGLALSLRHTLHVPPHQMLADVLA